MSFFSPSAAWLFLLALPLVALYFLKLKRPRVTVPSLVLWRRVLDDQRVNSPFQRFKRNLLLLLQLLLLLLLILAAMQPFFRGTGNRMARLPVLIDCSASMAAVEKRGGPTRLELAKERVSDMIAGLLPDQEMAIISFSDTARQRSGFTNNTQLLRDALDDIEVEEVPSQIDHAFRMARALSRGVSFDEVMLLSDGNLPGRASMDLPFKVNYQQLAAAGANIGITTCSARRDRDEGWEIFVEVGASAGADYGGALTMTSAGQKEPLASELVTTKPGQAARLLLSVSGYEEQELTFTLTPNAAVDAVESDNVAYLRLPALRALQVYVPETLSSFRHALASIDNLEVYPNQRNLPPGQFDLVIADDEESLALPARVQLKLGQVPEPLQTLVQVEQKSNQAIDWKQDASLLKHVDFSNVVFLDQPIAEDFQPGVFLNLGFEVLVYGSQGPLLLQERQDEQLSIHALFHPDRSTFPFRVGFPVFVANVVEVARQAAGLSEAKALRTGIMPGMLTIPEIEVSVAGPDTDLMIKSDAGGRLPGVNARRVGLYGYAELDLRRGASLLSLSETSLSQVEVVEFREARVQADSKAVETDRPLWQWLTAVALLILLVEWWFFQRRPGGWTRARASR